MYKLDLEKAEEEEIKLPTSIRSEENQENSIKNKSISATLTKLKPLIVWIKTNDGKFFKRWEYQKGKTTKRKGRPPFLPLRNLYAGQEATAVSNTIHKNKLKMD